VSGSGSIKICRPKGRRYRGGCGPSGFRTRISLERVELFGMGTAECNGADATGYAQQMRDCESL